MTLLDISPASIIEVLQPAQQTVQSPCIIIKSFSRWHHFLHYHDTAINSTYTDYGLSTAIIMYISIKSVKIRPEKWTS